MNTAAPPGSPSRARALLGRAAALERIVYSSIARAIAHKPLVAEGARGFHHHAPILTVLIVFVVLSAVEIFIIDLIVHRWLWLRIPLLVLGVWGVVWMIGMLCAHFMRPHTVGPEGIRVRDGMDMDVALSWDDIQSVAVKKRVYEPKTPKLIDGEHGRTLVRHVTDETNIEIVLERPTEVLLPGAPPRGGAQTVTAVCLWADRPIEFLEAVRQDLGRALEESGA